MFWWRGCYAPRQKTSGVIGGRYPGGPDVDREPEELAGRLAAEATWRGMTVEELVAELVAARLPAEDDPLEAFIGSGASGRSDLGRRHRQIRAELTEDLAARDL
jgi:hypothetical protein